jgi:hypothetical protein
VCLRSRRALTRSFLNARENPPLCSGTCAHWSTSELVDLMSQDDAESEDDAEPRKIPFFFL